MNKANALKIAQDEFKKMQKKQNDWFLSRDRVSLMDLAKHETFNNHVNFAIESLDEWMDELKKVSI